MSHQNYLDNLTNPYQKPTPYRQNLDDIINDLVSKMNLESNSILLDVGSKDLRYKKAFHEINYAALDIFFKDTSKKDLALLVNGDICNIPYKAKTFNYILCTEVLEHVYDPFLAFKELSRILKPTGILLLSVPYLNLSPHGEYWRFNVEGLKELCLRNDLKIIEEYRLGNLGAIILNSIWQSLFSQIPLINRITYSVISKINLFLYNNINRANLGGFLVVIVPNK